ncbi:MAG TPA: TetR/AcrR family transcriptional regulator [Acidimicrobiales bacterium]|nr:TetR/AcrR family transcriptional regulator [Acidimicrobiales bacterium]
MVDEVRTTATRPAPRRPPRRAGERGRSARNHEDRWTDIVERAGAIFYRKGYEATSLQDIADSVGMLKGSIYYYIKTKEDLLYELVSRAQDMFEATLEEDGETARSPAPVRLRAFIGRWMALTSREREWGLVAEREFMRLSRRRLRRVIERRDELSGYVKDIIRQGIDEGAFDPTTDESVGAAAIFELMKTSHLWHRPSGPLSMAELGDWYATFAIRGLGGPRWHDRGPG